MRVFGLTTGADTAGINVAIAGAFRRHAPDWDVRAMVASANYIQYPVDVPYSLGRLRELWDAAEVVHLHNTLHGHQWYSNDRKPIVLHHHGLKNGSERSFGQMVRDAADLGATQLASTLDLAIRGPSLTWLPAPVNLDAMRAIRRAHYRSGAKIRVGHAPTNRDIKGSAAFDDAMARLAAVAEPVVIERASWTDCLARKATVDAFWDQPVLGYGSNAIEAWAMGIPVISGIADPEIRHGMIARWGRLPFFEANEDTLYDALVAMLYASLRDEYARIGTEHVERWHDERVTVELLKSIYAGAKPTTRSSPRRTERPRWLSVRDKRAAVKA